jgi:hypothetical protein
MAPLFMASVSDWAPPSNLLSEPAHLEEEPNVYETTREVDPLCPDGALDLRTWADRELRWPVHAPNALSCKPWKSLRDAGCRQDDSANSSTTLRILFSRRTPVRNRSITKSSSYITTTLLIS